MTAEPVPAAPNRPIHRTIGRSLHGIVSRPLGAILHALVKRLPQIILPADLRLKHHFDYEPVWVAVDRITCQLNPSTWRTAKVGSAASDARAWLESSGGWKALQRHPSRNFIGRFVLGGSWDEQLQPLRSDRTISQLFDQEVAAHETDEYRRLRRYLEDGDWRRARGLASIDDLDAYFDDLIATYHSIAAHGYRTQRELGEDGADEIRVCIARDGTLAAFGGGTHRLAIARNLGLEHVPVIVKRVHRRWVETCLAREPGSTEQAIRSSLAQI